MARFLIVFLLAASISPAAKEDLKFEGIWKAEQDGKVVARLTILSDRPPRGTIARNSGMELYIQSPHVVKGVLRFKTVDPNDGEVDYELRIVSASSGALKIGKAPTLDVKRE